MTTNYDPMAAPPKATNVPSGSGGGNPTQPAVAPLRRDGTAAAAQRDLNEAFANLHRDKDTGGA